MQRFKKILIANRGEIANRVVETCHKLNIMTGIIYTEHDKDTLAVKNADEKYPLTGSTIRETYLNIDQIVSIAKKNRFDAIHPGYGFLSENADFARACQKSSIIFIGPRSEIIELMGDKIKSKDLARESEVPVLQPITGNTESLKKNVNELDYPVLIKAASGGGGKGMRVVKRKEELYDALVTTSREAKSYFGDERIFIEKYIEKPRHIEVQVLADHFGNSLILFDRECSLQRRHQKVIEEAPSPSLNARKRKELLDHARKIIRASNYTNAGTIEFMADENLNFYFLEMNTRIQVEHPTTEMITGIDLVEEQIKIAEGKELLIKQGDLKINGHAIEARVYAEDPENKFFPSPGKIHFYREPVERNIRIDSSIDGPGEITDEYDPMISKIIGWGKNRNEAIDHLRGGLANYIIHGVKTNILFLIELLKSSGFKKNNLSTHFIDQHAESINKNIEKTKSKILPETLIAFTHFYWQKNTTGNSIWNEIGYWRIFPRRTFIVEKKEMTFYIRRLSPDEISVVAESAEIKFQLVESHGNVFVVRNAELENRGVVTTNLTGQIFISINGFIFLIDRKDNILTRKIERTFSAQEMMHDGQVSSPMPGKIIEINVKEKQTVSKGEKLLVLEAMKMENIITSPIDGTIKNIFIKLSDRVEAGKNLVQINPNKTNLTHNQKKVSHDFKRRT